MKYKDLPNERLIQKLLATSFESPSANRQVYDWCEEILLSVRFLENERVKLVKKYGEDDGRGNTKVSQKNYKAFVDEFDALLNMDIDKEISNCPIKRDWFDDDKCSFAQEKQLWLTPSEIGKILNIENAG